MTTKRSTGDHAKRAAVSRKRLEQFVDETKETAVGAAEVVLSPDLAEFFAAAFSAFLSGSVSSLDEALHLDKIPGRPKSPVPDPKKVDLTIRAFPLMLAGKTWEEIGEELGGVGTPIDGSNIRRIVERHRDAAISSMAVKVGESFKSQSAADPKFAGNTLRRSKAELKAKQALLGKVPEKEFLGWLRQLCEAEDYSKVIAAIRRRLRALKKKDTNSR